MRILRKWHTHTSTKIIIVYAQKVHKLHGGSGRRPRNMRPNFRGVPLQQVPVSGSSKHVQPARKVPGPPPLNQNVASAQAPLPVWKQTSCEGSWAILFRGKEGKRLWLAAASVLEARLPRRQLQTPLMLAQLEFPARPILSSFNYKSYDVFSESHRNICNNPAIKKKGSRAMRNMAT